ncbi:MAG TPA: carboxypeptidase regulatory-like domain-containing protein [Acidobacteriaceae bacterium]|nr:carboxypeptidase regulatory-like domain-containing protein [Acidobacteriaceae bacterium]
MLYNSPQKSRKFFGLFLILSSFLLVALPGMAQFRASIQGTVTDPTGAIIPGATVTLTDTTTNHTVTATTSGSGVYTFNGLPPNNFTLTATAPGFKKKTLKNLQLLPEQANSVNVQLALGAAAQTVTVNGSQVNLLNTETATLSGTVTSNEIQHLPSFNRDVFQLAQLAPGTFGDASQGQAGGSFNLPGSAGPGGPTGSAAGIFQTENQVQLQAIGGQNDTNGISVDGISTVSAVWGGASVITPSEDSVQNVTIVSNSYDAENGRFSGAHIQVISKSGSNHVHGSAFFKASRPGLNAYQRFNGYVAGITPSSTPADKGVNRDEDRTNNYGASLGGPLWKNKIFAFFDYETSPLSGSETSQEWFETPEFDSTAATAGSIAAKYLAFPGEAPASNALVTQTCAQAGLTQGVNCDQTTGGLDVGSPLTTGLGMQDLTYGGNSGTPGVGSGLDGVPDLALYNVVDPTTISQAQYNGRLDVLPDQKDHITFAIYWVPVTKTNYNGPTRAANLWHHSQINDAFSGIWNHVFSSTLLNQARANAAGYRWDELSSNPQAPFGLPQDNINSYSLNGGFQFFGPPAPSDLNQWTYDYNDIVTKTLGNHNIKFGGELTRLYYLNNNLGAARPTFNFNNLWDFANDAPYNETGQFDSTTGVPFANRQDNRENIWAAFVQDDYKVLPNLTLNLGLRWSYFGAMYSKENNMDVLQLGSGANTLAGMNIRVGGHLYTPQKNNFGPQVGFAWQPGWLNQKVVLRGGFGINYNQNEIAITANGEGNPPNAVSGNFTCPYPYTANPTCAGNGILYETAGNVNSIFGYAPNPAAITTFDSSNFPVNYGTGIFVTGFQSNLKTIATYHYSLQMEDQLPFESVFTLGYNGNQTRHQFTQMNYNVYALGHGVALNPKANFVDYYPNIATANYNAMIATLRHAFAHGFNLQAQYTWAKTMDEGSSPYEEDPYPFDPRAAYGRADYNVQNAFKLFGLWEPVFFHGNNLLEKTLGGWTLGGIWNVHTGFPFNPVYNTTGPYYQGSGYGQLRPAGVVRGYGTKTNNSVFMGASNPNYGGNPTKYFLPPTYVQGPAFPASAPPPTPGIHRNSLTGPSYNDVDASLSKSFGLPNNRVLGNNAVFEVRADAYNLFNKINLNGGAMDDLVGSAAPDGTITSVNSHFGVPYGALGGRTVQLQARFSF